MKEMLEEFKTLLDNAKGLGGSLELLLLQVEPEIAKQIELCAIPHQFNPEILQVLSPSFDKNKAASIYEEITNFSIVIPLESDAAAIHDEARLLLFRRWLTDKRYQQFQQISQQLAEYFKLRINDTEGALKEAMVQSHMYHLLGVDQDEGFKRFEGIFDIMWHQYRLNECDNLIKLVNEYNTVLNYQYKLWLKYYQGKVAAERHHWEQAEKSLTDLLADNKIEVALTIKVGYRLGIIYSQQRKWDLAIEVFNTVLDLAQTHEEHHDFVDEIMHGIGIVYRDNGELILSEQYLQEALKIAIQQHDLASMANAYNSIGSLHQKCGNTVSAIKMYKASLQTLTENHDKFRPAQVYNNLGMSYAEQRDWLQSKDYFEKSLNIKTKAGDTRGRALTLTNLVRVYMNIEETQMAVNISNQAISLFEEVKDSFNVAKAKCNLGRIYRNRKELDFAKKMFTEAQYIFESLHEVEEAKKLELEIAHLGEAESGMPWYAWSAIILFVLLMIYLAMYI